MVIPKRYDPQEAEPRLAIAWDECGIHKFAPQEGQPVFSIDTPPPTVSGRLHLGHVYSYSHTDFIARYRRMRGDSVFYPMGFDDNGLPTERLVEQQLGVSARQVGRKEFIAKCLEVSAVAEQDYRRLWQRLGLSIDWRYAYRTIDAPAQRISQKSFLDLYRQGMAYRQEAPAIWCPECQTALAQADLNDMQRESELVKLEFPYAGGTGSLHIATTRPELLPACVAVFVHPKDQRYLGLPGAKLQVPLSNRQVPLLADEAVEPDKGTGVVMCCTFGDSVDVAWWRSYQLPYIEIIGKDGRMTEKAEGLAGMSVSEARRQIKTALQVERSYLGREFIDQTIRVHERCDTPVEYILTPQWFISLLDYKARLQKAGELVHWHPEHMAARYQTWVENLNWDWCITRQRFYGVPFPAWYCQNCGEVMLADESELPVDPLTQQPDRACQCGAKTFIPDIDVMDTWATSSLSPQIAGQWLDESGHPGQPSLYRKVFPFSLRPQAHEIIRTWAFYTLVKSLYHFDAQPWKDVMISGWGIAGEGMGKISKSRGGGPLSPIQMIETYSADALRYWAASSGTGKDAVISEDKIRMGAKLVTKIWNVAGFSARFLEGYIPQETLADDDPRLTPADHWILARLNQIIRKATRSFDEFDYSTAKNEVEAFFWKDFADNYIEMIKLRLYDICHPQHVGACIALFHVFRTTLKLFAPILPFVTDEVYRVLFAAEEGGTIHTCDWPQTDPKNDHPDAVEVGNWLVQIATGVRRYKSEHGLSLGSELNRVQIALNGLPDTGNSDTLRLAAMLEAAIPDLLGITRAQKIEILHQPLADSEVIERCGFFDLYI